MRSSRVFAPAAMLTRHSDVTRCAAAASAPGDDGWKSKRSGGRTSGKNNDHSLVRLWPVQVFDLNCKASESRVQRILYLYNIHIYLILINQGKRISSYCSCRTYIHSNTKFIILIRNYYSLSGYPFLRVASAKCVTIISKRPFRSTRPVSGDDVEGALDPDPRVAVAPEP